MSLCCSWLREACGTFWKLIKTSSGSSSSNVKIDKAECRTDEPANIKSRENNFSAAGSGSNCGGGSKIEGSYEAGGFSGGRRFIRTKFPFANTHPTAATMKSTAAGVGGEPATTAATCRQFYGRLRHCDSRTSLGGPLYRYVSSLSLELQAAAAGSSGGGTGAPHSYQHHHHHYQQHQGDCGSSWQERDIVASQLMDKLASRDLPGAARYCRLLLTLEPYNDEVSRLLDSLELADRDSPLLYEDDLVHAGYCSDEMDSENTDSETQFRYFHHDQHGLNEDERRSRRTTSESDAFLDASSSSSAY